MQINYFCLPFHDLSLEQLYEIMALRQEVFIVEQDCPYLDADGKDFESFHLFGKNELGKIISYTRLVPQGVSYEKYASIGRVVTSAKVRGLGTGKDLMVQSIEWCVKLFPKSKIKISAQCYLEKFYTDLGFNKTGEFYDEDGIPHMGMIYGNLSCLSPIKRKTFINRKGIASSREDLYLEYKTVDYYIKFCESTVDRISLEELLKNNEQSCDAQNYKLEFKIKNGEWDVCPEDKFEVQSRIGDYAVLFNVET